MAGKTTFEGPLFINAPRHLKDAANTALMEVATRASVLVKVQLWGDGKNTKHGRKTGRLRSSILGELVKDFHAVVKPSSTAAGNPMVYANWVEGIDDRNSSAGFAGYSMFKNVGKELNSRPKWLTDIFGEALMKEFGP